MYFFVIDQVSYIKPFVLISHLSLEVALFLVEIFIVCAPETLAFL